MGAKSRWGFTVDGCIPNENKCRRCIYIEDCEETVGKKSKKDKKRRRDDEVYC